MNANEIENIAKSSLVIGYRQIVKGINGQHFRCVVLAVDSDELFKAKVTELCQVNKISLILFNSKEELGKVANIDVPCGVIGVLES